MYYFVRHYYFDSFRNREVLRWLFLDQKKTLDHVFQNFQESKSKKANTNTLPVKLTQYINSVVLEKVICKKNTLMTSHKRNKMADT